MTQAKREARDDLSNSCYLVTPSAALPTSPAMSVHERKMSKHQENQGGYQSNSQVQTVHPRVKCHPYPQELVRLRLFSSMSLPKIEKHTTDGPWPTRSLLPFVTLPNAGGMLTSGRPAEAKPRDLRRRAGAPAQPWGLESVSPTHPTGPVTGHTKEPAAGAGRGDSPQSREPHLVPARWQKRPAGKSGLTPKPVAQFGSLSPRNEQGRSRAEKRAARSLRAAAAPGRPRRGKGGPRSSHLGRFVCGGGGGQGAGSGGVAGRGLPSFTAQPLRPAARAGEESRARWRRRRRATAAPATRPRGLRASPAQAERRPHSPGWR